MDARRTETSVATRHVDASRGFYYFFSERAALGGGCGALPDFIFVIFPLFSRQ